MNAYTTQARIEAYLGRELTANELILLDGTIDYISSFIDSYTNRAWDGVADAWEADKEYSIGDFASFNGITYECIINNTSEPDNKPGVGDDWETYWSTAEAEPRLFNGNGQKELFIDDFTSLEEVQLLDGNGDSQVTLDDEDEWILQPANKTTKQSIYLRGYSFPYGLSSVMVTAVFGSGSVPMDVVMVATALSAKYINRMGSSVSGFKRESIEGYSYELISGKDSDEEALSLLRSLDRYKKVIL